MLPTNSCRLLSPFALVGIPSPRRPSPSPPPSPIVSHQASSTLNQTAMPILSGLRPRSTFPRPCPTSPHPLALLCWGPCLMSSRPCRLRRYVPGSSDVGIHTTAACSSSCSCRLYRSYRSPLHSSAAFLIAQLALPWLWLWLWLWRGRRRTPRQVDT
ncbi:hypothetical protein EDB81DRAFT_469339 [Dactylonectria macrodidyma]|uniref:Uncharacterized protein n=1 Tax=Dactylonectria macrodidyma TaxID=307937 RepID=A0A9P9EZ42_9HYPO|nr:hypothetical protein EDB81DRAFT_469339 [Dactylonectria macrodidyma]